MYLVVKGWVVGRWGCGWGKKVYGLGFFVYASSGRLIVRRTYMG